MVTFGRGFARGDPDGSPYLDHDSPRCRHVSFAGEQTACGAAMYTRNMIFAVKVCALASLSIAAAQPPASARAVGNGGHPGGVAATRTMHWRGHKFRYRNRFGYALPYGYYGGVVAVGSHPYEDFGPYVLPQELVPVNEPQRVLDCKRTRQTVTVPSEDGGTRDIDVTRC